MKLLHSSVSCLHVQFVKMFSILCLPALSYLLTALKLFFLACNMNATQTFNSFRQKKQDFLWWKVDDFEFKSEQPLNLLIHQILYLSMPLSW